MPQNRLSPVVVALSAAFLFGASTPAAKVLSGQIEPQLLAGLLYLGSGAGLTVVYLLSALKPDAARETKLQLKDLPWLFGTVLFGGAIAPFLLMTGLTTTDGSEASLLLNLEAVFTALLAWFVFKENFDKRIFLGMVAIVLGTVVLVWKPGLLNHFSAGATFVVAACLCWAIDNNLTRKISDADPVVIASIKGLAAGVVNTGLMLSAGHSLPAAGSVASAMLIGFFGYGVSLVLFIRSLRYLGTARTGAYFSTAPFSGTVLSIILLHEPVSWSLAIAGALMGVGVWLHVTEKHAHLHTHLAEEHEHLHWHDEHHQHSHLDGMPEGEPHTHSHKHAVLTHSHEHFPDTHHQHKHEG